MYKLINDDCLQVLKKLEDNSVDSLVTDPPAGIAFMGKDWDKDKGGRDAWISWMQLVMSQCLRVMKPGAHGFVWALPRTSHWTATALENAGFDIRDIVTHVFGSGFPKSHNISKAIDKAAGAEREVIERVRLGDKKSYSGDMDNGITMSKSSVDQKTHTPNPITNEAKKWDGWGTALKPANEHWILIRKPLSEKTVAKNVLKHGTGGINIDASRVEFQNEKDKAKVNDPIDGTKGYKHHAGAMTGMINRMDAGSPKGRFPSNFICSDEARDVLDDQSGVTSVKPRNSESMKNGVSGLYKGKFGTGQAISLNDSGGASRFFYCAKSSKSERNAGCDKPNGHPTVKSQKLMTYLIKMVTPPGGKVLDPFTGSGSTGVSAIKNGFEFIGIEQSEEYTEIANSRLEYAKNEAQGQMSLLKS